MGELRIGALAKFPRFAIVFSAFLCLPALFAGGELVVLGAIAHFRSVSYLEYPYFKVGLGLVSLSLFQALLVVLGSKWKGAWKALTLIAIVVGFGVAMESPEYRPIDVQTSNHIWQAVRDLNSFSEEHRRFPKDEAESPPSFFSPGSPYLRNGQRLPFQTTSIFNATGPYLGPVDDRPGVMFYAVSPEMKDAWLTGTQLAGRHPVGNYAGFIRYLSQEGDDRVIHLRAIR